MVIAGAGVIGLATAWALRRRGATVTVLDAGRAGREASWAGGGILWPIYPWRYPASVQSMAQRGVTLYPDLCAELSALTGIDPEWRRTGLLVLDRAEQAAAIRWAECASRGCERLTPERLRRHAPGVNAQEGAVLLSDVAQVRNPRLCRALSAALRKRGVAVQEHQPVREVVQRGGRFVGFRTEHGLLAADAGVIACGAWARNIAGVVGMPSVEPVRGQMLLFAGTPGNLRHILVRRGNYAIPRADGRVVVGSTVEHVGFDQIPTAAVHQRLRQVAMELAPRLAECQLQAHWCGLRPATADGQAFVGKLPAVAGLYASIGHYRNGLVQAPAAAEMLATELLAA